MNRPEFTETRYLDNAKVDHGKEYHCDLCYDPQGDNTNWLVQDLRVVCSRCLHRFNDEYDELPPSSKINFTIGFVKRGYYANSRATPPSNGLGGRD